MLRMTGVVVLFVAIGIINLASATERGARVWSYTPEEMRNAARAYVAMRNSPDPNDFESILKAGEFKGYIAGLIDMHASKDQAIEACARRLSVNDLAGRSALLISAAPLDRSSLAVAATLVALRMSCDDKNFLDGKAPNSRMGGSKETGKSVPALPQQFQQPQSSRDREQQDTSGYVPFESQQIENGLSSFTVDNSSGAGDAIVRIYLDGKLPAVRSFFIKNGESFKAEKLKTGNYIMRYRYMGSEDTYEANRAFRLSEVHEGERIRYSNVRVTLYKVRDGNLSTKRVDPGSF